MPLEDYTAGRDLKRESELLKEALLGLELNIWGLVVFNVQCLLRRLDVRITHLLCSKHLFRNFGWEVPRHYIFYLFKLPLLPPRRVTLLLSCEACMASLLHVLCRKLPLADTTVGGSVGRELESMFHERIKSLFYTWQ